MESFGGELISILIYAVVLLPGFFYPYIIYLMAAINTPGIGVSLFSWIVLSGTLLYAKSTSYGLIIWLVYILLPYLNYIFQVDAPFGL